MLEPGEVLGEGVLSSLLPDAGAHSSSREICKVKSSHLCWLCHQIFVLPRDSAEILGAWRASLFLVGDEQWW